ncbi:hypothetical protein KR222_004427, partial [Zaprionus bogoriensis]
KRKARAMQSHIQHTADSQQQQQQHIEQQQQQQPGAAHTSNMYEAAPQEQEDLDLDVNLNFSSFEELCRLCAVHHGPLKLHIFEPEAEQRQLPYKLRTLLQANVSSAVAWPTACFDQPVSVPLQISKDDFLPKRICELCLGRLEHLYEWRQLCLRNEQLLRNYAASMHTVRATIDFQVSAGGGGGT